MPEDDRPKVSAAEIEALYWEEGRLNAEMLTRLAEEATATAATQLDLSPPTPDEVNLTARAVEISLEKIVDVMRTHVLQQQHFFVEGLKSGRRDLIVNAIAVVGSVVVGTFLGWWLTTP